MSNLFERFYQNVPTIIVCVLFLIVFVIFMIVICRAHVKKQKRKRNKHAVLQESPVLLAGPAQTTVQGGYTVTQIQSSALPNYPTQAYNPPYPVQAAPVQMHIPVQMPVGSSNQNYAPGMPLPTAHQVPPYPVMQPPSANVNPPPYDLAVAGSSMGQPNIAGYEKQAPYNPNFRN